MPPSATRTALLGLAVAAALAAGLLWLAPRRPEAVVVYTSVDAEYAQALKERFERATGRTVTLRTDSEADKTTGLLGRLRTLKDRPDGDVFWNSELSGTLLLAREGLLAEYRSPAAQDIPERFRAPNGLWTGFGLRARVLIYNTQFVKAEEAPKTLEELAQPVWRGRFCLARPLFGTTRSHLAALVLAHGEAQGFVFLRALRENGSAGGKSQWIVDGNAAVRERVADGTFHLGVTDTDDVYEALDRKRPVNLVFLQQTAVWPGVFLIPNSVALLRGAPNPEGGKAFIDFLLSPATEEWLAAQGARQIPVRASVSVPAGLRKLDSLTEAKVDYKALAEHLEHLSLRIDRLLSGEEP